MIADYRDLLLEVLVQTEPSAQNDIMYVVALFVELGGGRVD